MKDIKFNKNGELEVNGKSIKLTEEQMSELDLKDNPFNVKIGDNVHYINNINEVDCFLYLRGRCQNGDYWNWQDFLIAAGKQCKSENLMKQRKLRRDLDDLIFKFAVENDCLHSNLDIAGVRYFIFYDVCNGCFDVVDNYRITHIGTIYFKDCESCRKCIKEVVEPYWEKHKDEWDWNYEY